MSPEEYDHLIELFGLGIHSCWYIGLVNSIDTGVKNLEKYLAAHGHILIEIPELFDYLNGDQINYFILYKSLPKLEYLEYMYKKKVNKNA